MSTPFSAVAVHQQTTVTVIAPKRKWVGLNLRELWLYRELVYFLAWRDLKVRYKQTAIGIAWAVMQPLFTMLVFKSFFWSTGQDLSEGFCTLCSVSRASYLGTFFANAISSSSNGLVESSTCLRRCIFRG